MQAFQNARMVSSPHASTFDPYSSNVVGSQRPMEPVSGFRASRVGGASQFGVSTVGMSRSGMYASNVLGESTVRGIGRGIGNLPEDRLRKIAKDFLTTYGNGTELGSMGLMRIQREAYDNCPDKLDLGDDSVRELQKTMDQNRDGRVTEEDMMSLCRRYLSCDKRPIVFTPVVEERLAVARRLFKQFDVEKKGYLT